MANTSSAKKAVRKIAARTLVNKSRRSRVRSFIRKFDDAVAAGDRQAADIAFKAAEPEIMRAAGKGVIHKNTAARKVSRLARRLNSLGAWFSKPDFLQEQSLLYSVSVDPCFSRFSWKAAGCIFQKIAPVSLR